MFFTKELKTIQKQRLCIIIPLFNNNYRLNLINTTNKQKIHAQLLTQLY